MDQEKSPFKTQPKSQEQITNEIRAIANASDISEVVDPLSDELLKTASIATGEAAENHMVSIVSVLKSNPKENYSMTIRILGMYHKRFFDVGEYFKEVQEILKGYLMNESIYEVWFWAGQDLSCPLILLKGLGLSF